MNLGSAALVAPGGWPYYKREPVRRRLARSWLIWQAVRRWARAACAGCWHI